MRGGELLSHFSIMIFTNVLVTKQKGESHNGGDKKTTHLKSSEKYVWVSGVRNLGFSENFACFVFLLPPL